MLHPMTTVRWGIIGCGDVTEVKSGPGFQKARGSSLVAVMRRDGAKAEDYARRHGVPRWYNDAEALVRDPEVDAVYVATPPSSHCDYTRARARAAGKPVYVEKPMALDHGECRTHGRRVPRRRRAALHRLLPPRPAAASRASRRCSTPARSARSASPPSPSYRAVAPPAGALPWRVDPAISGGGLLRRPRLAPARSARLLPRPDRAR